MADNDIIDFYKKADTNQTPEEPLKEQVETPEPVVSESVSIPVPESSDPFDKFLFNLAEKLKTEKKITEQQQQQFNERVVQPTTNPEDPFAKFLESFAGLVKQDENINKEENIKEATIDFINKLKNDDFFDYKKEEPKEEVKPESKKKLKKYLPPKFVKKIEKVEEDTPVIEQSIEPEPEQPSNPYVKELQTAEKKKSKVEDKISGLSDIKKIIAQQVQEQLSKYPNLGFTGGGGGTNAVQYAQGGTMNGDLTVNGTVNASTYLSGGVNLANLLSSSGGGSGFADRFVSGPSQFILDPDGKLHPLDNDLLTLQSENAALSAFTRVVLSPYGFFAYDNNSNSITFDSITDDITITSQDLYEWTFNSEGKLIGPSGTLSVSGNVDVTNKFLSGGVDLADIFITSAEESQTLTYDTQTELLSIARGNSVSLASLNDKGYVNSNFLKLSGGTLIGNLSVYGNTFINNNLTVGGNLTALGTATFANTIFTTTSALSVYNTGPGPALYVYQAAGPYDVASFYDGDGIEVLHVGNAGPGGLGKVGINESFPNEELTVRGSISATESIFATNILSGGVDLKDIFLTQETDSQTLTFAESAAQLTISNGNTVSLSSLQSNYIYTNISQNVLSNRRYAFDTSNSSLTATLPASPQIGDEIEFFDITGYWFINNLVIANNGKYIEQKLETLECDVKFGCIQLVYVGPIDNIGWRIIPKPRHSVPSIISPIVSISSNISLGYDPVIINFAGINNLNNIVAPVNNWYWNLTGGNIPDYFTQNVSYNYSTPGVYTVNLTASNAVGTGTASKTITALPVLVPVPTISSNLVVLSGYTPLTASFIGLNTLPVSSSPVSNWYWNLTGGNTADYTTQTVTYVYQTSGSYVVNLSASNASGIGTASVNITASVVPPIIPPDPYYNNVSLLLHMDGTQGSTTFIDSSNNNFTVTPNGGAQINTTIKKIGSGSGYFDGNGDFISVANDAKLNFGTSDDFTIEGWIRFNSLEDGVALVSKGTNSTSSGWTLYYYQGQLYLGIPYVSNDINASFTPSLNTWYYLTCTRNSGTVRLFVDGNIVATASSNTKNYTTTEALRIGYSHSNNYLNGYVDEVRITKGVARYTSNFTLSTEPFPNY